MLLVMSLYLYQETGHVAVFHVYFGGCLGGHLSIKSVLHLIVVIL